MGDRDDYEQYTDKKDTHVHVVNVTQKVSQSQKNGNGCLSWIGGAVVLLIVLAMVPALLSDFQSEQPHEPDIPGDRTLQFIRVVDAALERFRSDVGRRPNGEEGLEALRRNPGVDRWRGPYVYTDEALNDEWGRPLRYSQSANNRDGYAVYSLGRDDARGGFGPDTDVAQGGFGADADLGFLGE